MRSLMGQRLNSGSLNRPLLLLSVLLCSATAMAQKQVVVKAVFESPAVTALSVDRRGDFYLAFKNGTLAKYDTAGKEVVNYSPRRLGAITLVDPWNPLKTFLFYEEFQSIVLLDRFMAPTVEYDLTGKSQSFIRLACPSQDNTFWLIDESYNGLLKYDPLEQQVQSKIPFNASVPLEGRITFIREYQNVLFAALSTGGIAYFDNLGTYLGKIETDATDYFGFQKNQVYWTNENVVMLQDLYSSARSELILPDSYEKVILMGNAGIGIKKEGGYDLLRVD